MEARDDGHHRPNRDDLIADDDHIERTALLTEMDWVACRTCAEIFVLPDGYAPQGLSIRHVEMERGVVHGFVWEERPRARESAGFETGPPRHAPPGRRGRWWTLGLIAAVCGLDTILGVAGWLVTR